MSSPQDAIQHTINDHIAVITMNNPPANTWTADSLNALKTLVLELNQNKDVYALVITGNGEKFFSAGADLKLFADGDKAVALDMARAFGEAFETLSDFRGVSIAAINGYAMGGGLEVALACDLRVVEEQAVLALPEAKVGLLPCAGGTQNLTALVGEGWAKRMILCGEQLSATQANELGLAEELVPKGEALTKAMALALSVANQSPSSVAACKLLIQNMRSAPLKHGLIKERELFLNLFDTEDQTEGVRAFLEKREPKWKNQ
ncbi:enoyl-CoA hydratase [Vibrio natriegens]|uniref:Enoyl-CoA hydratase n=1 Tax=Vibrio natriegens NBRC 15636 = ATCC 14048 = DSM 759 TaxID=1219067 RepID=A0AAN1CXS3_VIBNA|nr:enoyl-CoA hydratase [Vibrio natriegens]ALR18486.1 enoyl-CoA hydratase [Vibrio natriegens NBRC 15636 = ATCC 14048 = DSM 759]ANQ14438.1 enoyl-CoA hydratase [Vibrio natriegens NBRC 15636 = ATCC 14048 = DSM 759]EPM38794.1 enoyl-CoA hydratase [Vibrio natriegens NBRC 15636 = ATCC 14048 = DSM 759]MDX6028612.1 enoyl-CoA hydratase [Vibrio natriegens NBRC 15636 = ATCC 14048 = DSM 759]UUI14665.1 enoyl-CoA hydratase [Vibrio natriegens]